MDNHLSPDDFKIRGSDDAFHFGSPGMAMSPDFYAIEPNENLFKDFDSFPFDDIPELEKNGLFLPPEDIPSGAPMGKKRTLGLSAEGILAFKKLRETEQEGGQFGREHEENANQLLEENLQVINIMRENLMKGKAAENVELMIRFRNNLLIVLRMLSGLSKPGTEMAPLPVKLNTSFFPASSFRSQDPKMHRNFGCLQNGFGNDWIFHLFAASGISQAFPSLRFGACQKHYLPHGNRCPT